MRDPIIEPGPELSPVIQAHLVDDPASCEKEDQNKDPSMDRFLKKRRKGGDHGGMNAVIDFVGRPSRYDSI
jgi:hypothetical protein